MKELDFLSETARAVGAFARERYKDDSPLQISQKSDRNDLVTEVDVAVQRQVVERIEKAFPCDHVLAEESGLDVKPSTRPERSWILDPIDGTQNFVRSLFPAWGVSLAFAEHGVVTASGVYFPMTDDLFLAERGAGVRRNGAPVAVSAVDRVDTARVEFDISAVPYRLNTLEAAPEFYRRMGQIRIHGCAVAAMCSVATGDMEAYLHISLNPWDFAAAALIIEEAGGRCTRWDGSPLTYFDGRIDIVASNGKIHEETLSLLHAPIT
jgi:myo-inositol-1(or 4)-monophosphatase